MAKSNFAKANEKFAETVTGGCRTIESAVVGDYRKIEDTVVDGYRRVENAFVDRYLTHGGETVEEAKQRLKAERKETDHEKK